MREPHQLRVRLTVEELHNAASFGGQLHGLQVVEERNQEINTEVLVGQVSDVVESGVQGFGRETLTAQHSQSAGFTHGGNKLRCRDRSHSSLLNGIVATDQFCESSGPGGFPHRTAPIVCALERSAHDAER